VHGSEASLAEALRGSEHVDFVTPDYALEPEWDPTPEDAAKAEAEADQVGVAAADWGLWRIGAPNAKFTGKNSNVYVFDSGVNTRHDEFEKRAVPTLDWDSRQGRTNACVETDRDCADDYLGHGTHVAGIVGGREYGVAPDTTIRSMSMYFNTSDKGVSIAFANFDWLILNHQKPAVLQMSFGWPSKVAGAEVAINKVLAADISVVAAAGNSAKDACRWTWGFHPGVIVVAASDSRDKSAQFTNWGSCVTLYAPGVSINAANWRGGLTKKSGTSMAAPMVAGAAAMLLEENPALTPAEVKAKLVENAEPDALTGVRTGTPNLLLKVGEVTATEAPPAECPFYCGLRLCLLDACLDNCDFCKDASAIEFGASSNGCKSQSDQDQIARKRSSLSDDVRNVVIGCIGQSQSCVTRGVSQMGFSSSCSQCVGSMGTCAKDNCKWTCTWNGFKSEACKSCTVDYCFDSLVSCSGLPRSQLPDP